MAEGRTAWPKVDNDWFVEPTFVTDFLLARERLPSIVWDPSCGQGNITQTLARRGFVVFNTDIVQRLPLGYKGGWRQMDFLSDELLDFGGAQFAIVCNPPYGSAKTAEAFIRKALTLNGCTKVCMFLNSKFMFGQKRGAGLFAEYPPYAIYPINPRPSCPPGQFLLDGGKASGGVENFVWMTWIPGAKDLGTQISW